MISVGLASATVLVGVDSTSAQPDPAQPGDRRDRRERRDRDRRPAPPPDRADGPREAPPAPRVETAAARQGFVWITGRWEWRNSKWEWLAGHWERERAGKKWRDGKWDRRGDVYVYVDGTWIDDAAPAPGYGGPREAPPSPREEKIAARAGFVWIPGKWDWKATKWEWLAGHWERERAGKKWRDGRWDRKGDVYVYVDGDWIDAAVPAPGYSGPREAPPSPREERIAARAGFVWIPGRWDWKANKWEWLAGHWERERAGKKWRDGRWDRSGDQWAYVEGDWIDDAAPAPGYDRPREAPPSPREERMAARAGFVWVPGRWDWKAGKWEWLAGHYERERAGKRWREGRWDRNGDAWAYVEGDWIDSAAYDALPPPTDPDRRRRWRLERPIVGSYWPIKGKPGTRVVIRGRNFKPETIVIWAGEPLRGARVKDDEIAFIIPANATSSEIALRGKRRDLPVGSFEVVAGFDAVAEQRKLDDERRRAAEAAIAARQKRFAADRAAREAAARRRIEERAANREQRRSERIAALRAKWDRQFLADEQTQSELTLHAQRIADLERMREVAELSNNTKLAVRIEIALSREDARHDRRMTTLKTSFKGGKP
jgi:hypothetical protein